MIVPSKIALKTERYCVDYWTRELELDIAQLKEHALIGAINDSADLPFSQQTMERL